MGVTSRIVARMEGQIASCGKSAYTRVFNAKERAIRDSTTHTLSLGIGCGRRSLGVGGRDDIAFAERRVGAGVDRGGAETVLSDASANRNDPGAVRKSVFK